MAQADGYFEARAAGAVRAARVSGGAASEGIRMTEMIHPCSGEQPERRFCESGCICFWQTKGAFPPLPRQHLRSPGTTPTTITQLNLPAKHVRTGERAMGDPLICITEAPSLFSEVVISRYGAEPWIIWTW
ncbi:hypothetical protein RJ53_01485 [Methanocalculus chunghsingensis]|uniref:Uncharacterized protein n=1 Tax=Methanocalculus chunghsingensis TaxID=156457 RepID=A0A8J7W7V0_9EURY|nr:hypothetical protein [Methanocalculus chunghsingensis]MBR1368235.1 hypothetical protein [Methanocalculus chunghsingensis]